ncbi:MAG: SusC/RagA family TonB-linked outer membrane protein, partial [Chitinophaga sp.]
MKLTAILMVAAIFQASASGHAQTVTLSAETIPLKTVFAAIKAQTGYVVFSNASTINENQRITLSVKDMPLGELMDLVLKDLPVTYLIRGKTIVLSRREITAEQPAPPPGSASGTIRSASGEPLPGVSIRVKNTTVGTISAANGNFSLVNIPDNAVVIFSMLGYESVEVGFRRTENGFIAFTVKREQASLLRSTESNAPVLSLTLRHRDLSINDVVVNGYASISKSKYVGAVYSVRADDIKIAGETSIDQMLQGVVPGMSVMMQSGQVGSTPKIRIRGTSTILGNQEPVWVVDGIIQRNPLPLPPNSGSLAGDLSDLRLLASNAISWLNPNDIETITVLKDASATAIYGSQAANGVIVLTTKKGRPGQIAVSYNTSLSLGVRPSYGQYDLMNSQELMRFSKEVYEGRDSYTYNVLPIGYGGLVQQLQNKEISYEEYEAGFRKLENQNTDWFKYLFRNAFSQNHSLSISGGNEKLLNRTSLNMQKQIGEAKGNNVNNFSASSNTTLRLGDRLTVNLLLNGSVQNNDGFAYGVNPFDYAYKTSRTIPMYNEDGTLFYHEKRGTGSTAIPGKNSYLYNVQNELDNTGNRNTNSTLSTTADIRLKLVKGLEYQGLLSYTSATAGQKSYATELSWYITNERGYESGSVPSNSAEEKSSRIPFGGLMAQQSSTSKSYTFRNSLVYNRTFNKVHSVTVQGGIEARSSQLESNLSTRYGYLRYRGETFAPIPQKPVLISNGSAEDLHEAMRANSHIVNQESNYLSEYISAFYGFSQRYVLNFNARLDASNRFGQDKNKRFQPTWSVGGKWRMANEKWFRDVAWLNNLDLSATYGYQGNAVEEVSPYLIATDGGLSNLYNQYILNIKSLPYLDLGWEKTKSWNLGADISLFNGRVSATTNYFRKVSNVLSPRQVPPENGMDAAIVFGSEMENYGYDFIVNVIPVRTKNFTWQLAVNSGRTRNVIKDNQKNNLLEDYLNGTAVLNGRSYSTFYSYSFAGLSHMNGVPMFNFMDGKLSDDYTNFLVETGKLEPDFTGGVSTSLRYKRLSLHVMFSVAFGADKRLPVYYNASGAPTPEQNAPRVLNDRWKQPGDEQYTNIPAVPPGN